MSRNNCEASSDITADALRQLLSYDPETGAWTWLVDRNPAVHAGMRAGHTNDNRYVRIPVNGRCYSAARLAWLYMTGSWPVRKVARVDGDRSNNRSDNLVQFFWCSTSSQEGIRQAHARRAETHPALFAAHRKMVLARQGFVACPRRRRDSAQRRWVGLSSDHVSWSAL